VLCVQGFWCVSLLRRSVVRALPCALLGLAKHCNGRACVAVAPAAPVCMVAHLHVVSCQEAPGTSFHSVRSVQHLLPLCGYLDVKPPQGPRAAAVLLQLC
jgi:hypothetical protein